jgi:hypothetical protein
MAAALSNGIKHARATRMTDVLMSDACGPSACDTQADQTDATDATDAYVTWTSEALEPARVLLRPARPAEPCGMFHVHITDVTIDGLDTDASAAELACGHVFHAPALALHFLTNNMRCPVCRRGPADKAQISSFAPALQPDLTRLALAMHAREVAERAQETFGVDVSVEALLRDCLFEVYMQWAPDADAERHKRHRATHTRDRCTRLVSPLRLAAAPPASPASNENQNTESPESAENQNTESAQRHTPDLYATHRSFQRHFSTNLAQLLPGQHIISLSLSHPLMPESARSPMFDKSALLAAAAAGTRIALSRNIGYVLPVHSDAGLVLNLYLHTSYLSLVLVQQMIHWERQLS